MDQERNEDLNPANDDIEAKVKRMLDPSMPDDPGIDISPNDISGTKKSKPITVLHNDSPSQEESAKSVLSTAGKEETLPSAPELPSTKQKKSKKIIVPIQHSDEAVAQEPELKSDTAEDEPQVQPTAPVIKQITITDHNESASDVAEKLDQAISELSPAETIPKAAGIEDPSKLPEAQAEPQLRPRKLQKLPSEDVLETESPVIANPETDKAVADIIAKESDELLEVEDAVRDSDEPVKPVKKQRKSLGHALKVILANKALRRTTLFLILIGIFAAAAMPTSRYSVLNAAGIRASSSLIVLDESTQQPLKNVEVSLGNISSKTDEEGRVSLSKVKQGLNKLTISKRAFAPFSKDIVIGWGSNPLGDFKLTPTGSQYSFNVTDFLSGKPVEKVEAYSGEATAISDENGNIKLTVDQESDENFEVNIQGDNYRTEKLSVNPNDKSVQATKLVPSRKHVFISKRSGKPDIFSAYIDGKEEKQILAGSGKERDDMVLVPHPTDDVAVYVSTRAGKANDEGFLLSNLILINTKDNTTIDITDSERIQIAEWSGDRLIYVQIAAGASANSPKRYRLMAYHYKDKTNRELAASNFFNDVISIKGAIYYAPSSAYQTGAPGFYKLNADGSGFQTIFTQEVWNIFRTSYDQFALSVQQQWYDYKLGDKEPSKQNSAPSNQTSRVYIDNPDGKLSAWIDKRDGKGVLISYDLGTKEDKTLQSQSGLSYPMRWLNDKVIVYRVKTDREIADYALSIDGGAPVKIKDVTGSGGIDRWYYY